jgi:hypothetical protein
LGLFVFIATTNNKDCRQHCQTSKVLIETNINSVTHLLTFAGTQPQKNGV